ncbi:hypothetical protein V9K92_10265 [Phyllobacterium sp. CCNWLW109]|uniref:hypothetical protein n=1 Tax=Phyllobacterium sp. CCNWLW109 TaxID=3127479 RepID=UPI0030785B5F
MTNFVDTLTEFEKNHPDLYWSVGKGKLTENEPLYGAIIYLGDTEIGNGESDVNIESAFNAAFDSAGLQRRRQTAQPSGLCNAEDWENACHELFWETGNVHQFELIQKLAEANAKERAVLKSETTR